MSDYLEIVNWHEYQARTDKELPWLKLWGKLFLRSWWQEMEDDLKVFPIILLDTARRFNNKLPRNIDYYTRNYNIKASKNRLVDCSKLLCSIDFLSDDMSDCSPSPSPYPSKSLVLEKESEKKPFGESQAVRLSEEEFSKLVQRFGQAGAEARICRLENYILSKGKRYKSHYHTILNWASKDGEKSLSVGDGLTKAQRRTFEKLRQVNIENRHAEPGDSVPSGLLPEL